MAIGGETLTACARLGCFRLELGGPEDEEVEEDEEVGEDGEDEEDGWAEGTDE